MATDRREFIRNLVIGAGVVSFFPLQLSANTQCSVEHPFMPPRPEFKGVCHNCGMMRPMWARTWHTYTADGQTMQVCSMHCLAEATLNSGMVPEDVQVALYLDPSKNIPADQAYYLVGSKARGTMSMNSKLAFGSQEEADTFAGECGGSVVRFSEAYQVALKSIDKENTMIGQNRINKGKIVEPVDNKDVCPVCGMYAARFPKNKCQLQTMDGKVVHFCCTQCLFEFVKNSAKYNQPNVQAKFLWVIDHESGKWIYARNAYYVVGSNVEGPMGREAYPFVNLDTAKRFSAKNSGTIARFDKVTIDSILL